MITMIENVSDQINFSVPAQDQLITVTYGQLSDMILAATRQALLDAQNREENLLRVVQDLSDEVSALKRELSNINREIANVKRNASSIESDVDEIRGAFDTLVPVVNAIRKKVKVAEAPKKETARLGKLDNLLLARSGPVTFAEIGKVLELGSRDPRGKKNTRNQNMTHFGRIIAAYPDRYQIHQLRRGKAVTMTPEYRARLRQTR